MKANNIMENSEEVHHFLEEFTKRKPKTIPQELNDYLSYVARTGDPVYQWPLLKSLFKEKLLNVMTDFYETSPGIDIPSYPNVDPFNYETMKNSLLERFDTFNSAPFTVQRICELLTCPRKQYNRVDKFMRAMEKNILVVSTIEPGSQRRLDNENNDHSDRIVNGSDNNSECHVDVEMEDVSSKENIDQVSLDQSCSTGSNMSVEDMQPSASESQKTEPIYSEPSSSCYESLTPPSSDEEQADNCKVEENSDNSSQDPELKSASVLESSADPLKVDVDSLSPGLVIPKIVVEHVETMESAASGTVTNEAQNLITVEVSQQEKCLTDEVDNKIFVTSQTELNFENKEDNVTTTSENAVINDKNSSYDNTDSGCHFPEQQSQEDDNKEELVKIDCNPVLEPASMPDGEETALKKITEKSEEGSHSFVQSDTCCASESETSSVSTENKEPSKIDDSATTDDELKDKNSENPA